MLLAFMLLIWTSQPVAWCPVENKYLPLRLWGCWGLAASHVAQHDERRPNCLLLGKGRRAFSMVSPGCVFSHHCENRHPGVFMWMKDLGELTTMLFPRMPSSPGRLSLGFLATQRQNGATGCISTCGEEERYVLEQAAQRTRPGAILKITETPG